MGLPPPESTEGWAEDVLRWLLDVAPAHFRLDPVLVAQPVVLARRVVEHLESDLVAAREAWIPDVEQWTAIGLPAEAHTAVLKMLAQEGPRMAAQLRSATLVQAALTGKRWVARL